MRAVLLLLVISFSSPTQRPASNESNACDAYVPAKSDFYHLPDDTIDTLSSSRYSKRLQQLFKRAEIGRFEPIRFSKRENMRNISLTETSKDERVIVLRSGMDGELEENAIAHELFHLILQRQGFAAMVHVPESGLLTEMGYTITSCVDDALIDRKMALLGFNPKLLNHDTANNLIEQPPPPPINALIRDGDALLIYCYSQRNRAPGDQIERTWEKIDPDVVKRYHVIAQQIGDIKCKDARSCLTQKKHIRDVLAYPVTFCNPATGKFE